MDNDEMQNADQMRQKMYLGDAVYAQWDGYHIRLTTEDGINVTNEICLDPNVQVNLVKLIENIVE